ncbi:MAG: Hsp20 family protein [Gemmatimonadaceae bacterium]|nr:Hsp20 family protein [Gemmatimonadaceae bacterium]
MPNIRIQRAADGERDLPIFTEMARRMESVRQRAFELFAERGREEGHDLDDWITAEHEVLGWPSAELKEANGAFQVDITLPGFNAKEVEVTATSSELIVHAASVKEQHGEDEEVLWSEFGSNDVYRRFGFPRTVDADKITATLENGILKVRAPKLEVSVEPSLAAERPLASSKSKTMPAGTTMPSSRESAIDVPITG